MINLVNEKLEIELKKWNDILKRYVNNFHTDEINKISNILS